MLTLRHYIYYQTIWLDYDNVTAFPIIFMSFSG